MKYTAVAALLAASGLAGCESQEDRLVTGCHEAIQKRLKSPSSFSEIERFKVRSEPYTHSRIAHKTDRYKPVTDKRRRELRESLIAMSKRMEETGEYTISEFQVTYEAKNSFGVDLRSAVTCLIVHPVDTGAKWKPNVYINGQSHMSWLISQI
ncbi:MAG TPA: hypothetical protein ENH56_05705 [Roseobacter sp.]|uniref:Lipoprotein n=1 Tax=marine sediment metagenome TaxID=412755 RepID=A0A0F9T4E9_9ZZZZ|nr:hypothetical protein [Roseobacter sp.]